MSATQSLAASGSTAADRPALDQAKDGPGSSAADSLHVSIEAVTRDFDKVCDRIARRVLQARYRYLADELIVRFGELLKLVAEERERLDPAELRIDAISFEVLAKRLHCSPASNLPPVVKGYLCDAAGGRA